MHYCGITKVSGGREIIKQNICEQRKRQGTVFMVHIFWKVRELEKGQGKSGKNIEKHRKSGKCPICYIS